MEQCLVQSAVVAPLETVSLGSIDLSLVYEKN